MNIPEIPSKDMIVQHVYGGHGRIIGTLVGLTVGDKVAIGYSKCRRTDKFNRQTGIEIAKKRAYKLILFTDGKRQVPKWNMPHSLTLHFDTFCKRCSKYFKVSENLIESFFITMQKTGRVQRETDKDWKNLSIEKYVKL